MVRFLSTVNSPVVRVMVCPLRAGSNPIVSPSCASTSAWRREPGPLSLVLETLRDGVGVGVGVAVGVEVGLELAVGIGVGVGLLQYTITRTSSMRHPAFSPLL